MSIGSFGLGSFRYIKINNYKKPCLHIELKICRKTCKITNNTNSMIYPFKMMDDSVMLKSFHICCKQHKYISSVRIPKKYETSKTIYKIDPTLDTVHAYLQDINDDACKQYCNIEKLEPFSCALHINDEYILQKRDIQCVCTYYTRFQRWLFQQEHVQEHKKHKPYMYRSRSSNIYMHESSVTLFESFLANIQKEYLSYVNLSSICVGVHTNTIQQGTSIQITFVVKYYIGNVIRYNTYVAKNSGISSKTYVHKRYASQDSAIRKELTSPSLLLVQHRWHMKKEKRGKKKKIH